jgi:hypothetical protein
VLNGDEQRDAGYEQGGAANDEVEDAMAHGMGLMSVNFDAVNDPSSLWLSL